MPRSGAEVLAPRGPGLRLPARHRRLRFRLTPLADAMFQLLIFFMLSSNLTPYARVPLQSAAAPAPPPGVGGTTPSAPSRSAVWTLEAGTVIAGGQRFGFDDLPDLASALAAEDAAEVVLLVRPAASVQDLATVLEGLAQAPTASVRVAAGAR